MDLNQLQRTERRKTWIFAIIFLLFIFASAIEFSDYSVDDEEATELERCVDLLQNSEDATDEEIMMCRHILMNIAKPSKYRTTA